jgi:hypothetical protein
MTRILLAALVTLMLAFGAAAQSDSTSEFGRASGGSIDAITKAPRQLSGSLSLSRSSLGSGYQGSLGGEVLDDRLWFFAAASVLPAIQFATPEITAIDAKATAQPVDWAAVTASFTQLQRPVSISTVPSSFLSLRSTTMLSDRSMLNVSVSVSRPQ